MHQLNLNLRHKLTTAKKTERLSIPCGGEFLALVDKLATLKGTTRAEFAYEAVLKEMQSSMGEIFMAELHSEKKLTEFF